MAMQGMQLRRQYRTGHAELLIHVRRMLWADVAALLKVHGIGKLFASLAFLLASGKCREQDQNATYWAPAVDPQTAEPRSHRLMSWWHGGHGPWIGPGLLGDAGNRDEDPATPTTSMSIHLGQPN